MKILDRRTLLRGAGGIAIGLPFLEIMSRSGTAAAQTPPLAKRLPQAPVVVLLRTVRHRGRRGAHRLPRSCGMSLSSGSASIHR